MPSQPPAATQWPLVTSLVDSRPTFHIITCTCVSLRAKEKYTWMKVSEAAGSPKIWKLTYKEGMWGETCRTMKQGERTPRWDPVYRPVSDYDSNLSVQGEGSPWPWAGPWAFSPWTPGMAKRKPSVLPQSSARLGQRWKTTDQNRSRAQLLLTTSG